MMLRSVLSWGLRNRSQSQPFISKRSMGYEQHNGQVIPARRENILHQGVTHSYEPFHAKFLKDRKTVMERTRNNQLNQTETTKDGTVLLMNSNRDTQSTTVMMKELSNTQRTEGNRVIYSILAVPLLIPAFMSVKYIIDPVYRETVNQRFNYENVERIITSKLQKNSADSIVLGSKEEPSQEALQEHNYSVQSIPVESASNESVQPIENPLISVIGAIPPSTESDAPQPPQLADEPVSNSTQTTESLDSDPIPITLPITDAPTSNPAQTVSYNTPLNIDTESTPQADTNPPRETPSMSENTPTSASAGEAISIESPPQEAVVIESGAVQPTAEVQTPIKRVPQIDDDISDAISEIEVYRPNFDAAVQPKRERIAPVAHVDLQESERPFVRVEQAMPQPRRPVFGPKAQEPIYIEANNAAAWRRRLQFLKKNEPAKDSPQRAVWEEDVQALERMINSE